MDRNEVIRKSLRGGMVVTTAVALQYGLAFLIQAVLARLLSPEDFGALALISMAVMFFHALPDLHGGKYIIKERGEIKERLDNIFTLELILSLSFLALLFFTAPLIMEILKKPEYGIHARVLALGLLYIPFSRVQFLFERQLRFTRARLPGIVSQVVGGSAAIVLAYSGFGLWSLVWSRVITASTEGLFLWVIAPCRPRLAWNPQIQKSFLRFGLPLVASSVLIFFYWNVDYYIVDSVLGLEQLGYYWVAFQFSHYFLRAKDVINSVLLPAYANLERLEDRRAGFRLGCELMGFVYLFPLIAIFIFGDEIVTVVFGGKWLPSVLPLKIFLVTILVRAVGHNYAPLLYAAGNTLVDLKAAALNGLLLPGAVYFLCVWWGITGAALGVLAVSLVSHVFIFERFVSKLTGKGFLHFYWKPVTVVLLAAGLAVLLAEREGALPIRLCALAFLAGMSLYLFRGSTAFAWKFLGLLHA